MNADSEVRMTTEQSDQTVEFPETADAPSAFAGVDPTSAMPPDMPEMGQSPSSQPAYALEMLGDV